MFSDDKKEIDFTKRRRKQPKHSRNKVLDALLAEDSSDDNYVDLEDFFDDE